MFGAETYARESGALGAALIAAGIAAGVQLVRREWGRPAPLFPVDLLKIDRHFVAGVHADPHRRAVLESIADLAHRLGGEAVAEGIEDEPDLAAVADIGIALVQGYLLCHPCTLGCLQERGMLDEAAVPAAQEKPSGT